MDRKEALFIATALVRGIGSILFFMMGWGAGRVLSPILKTQPSLQDFATVSPALLCWIVPLGGMIITYRLIFGIWPSKDLGKENTDKSIGSILFGLVPLIGFLVGFLVH